MGLVIVGRELTKKDLGVARENYKFYIKVTADIAQGVVIIGGEYHADAEKILIEQYQSKQKNIWGGGFSLRTGKFETNALINLKPKVNPSLEILDSKIQEEFLRLLGKKLRDLKRLI